jgi:demethylmenaquinone methyltransferase/2-methoxy-6-polyprenyl-1,4-benzoquinol methylase
MMCSPSELNTRLHQTRDFFDSICHGAQWDSLEDCEAEILEEALQLAPILPGSYLLEAGCGAGRITRRLVPRVGLRGRVFAADVSERMLDRARADLSEPGAVFISASVDRLPLWSSSMDVALCFNSFHVFPCQAKALAEISRVLKPGGRLVIAHAEMKRNTRPPLGGVRETGASPSSQAPELIRLLEWHGFHALKAPRRDTGLLVVAEVKK